MNELNPNNPATIQARDLWHKVVGLLMAKYGLTEFVIQEADIARFTEVVGDDGAVVFDTRNNGLVIRIVDGKTAMELARLHGGLPA